MDCNNHMQLFPVLKIKKSTVWYLKYHTAFFLQKLLSDERLCQSEALYAFLSPSPEYLKIIDIQGKKSTFSLSSFLERLPGDFFSHQEVSGCRRIIFGR